ncbi:MAG TPA: crosslink repair DNA glycosylase YcaQ family protein, partial [Cryptosporangiaceae bacterium]|nr:crosslink repair DNA glycosylase YcaQ family protein [Cryptosporangiaceae bacterium]
LVPDPARRKLVWRAIGSPGAVLLDGEVTGVWRVRAAGRRLDVTVQPFAALSPPARRGIEDEAARFAAPRGLADVRVGYDERR